MVDGLREYDRLPIAYTVGGKETCGGNFERAFEG